MRTVILCGGKGTRAYPHTADLPKPLMEVAGSPILLQVMRIYAQQGFGDFVLAIGFMGELIEQFAATVPKDWNVTVVDTGVEAGTAERLAAVQDHVGSTFFATYGDGLGNVDLHALRRFHQGHPGAATLSTVPLPSQYGTVDAEPSGRVTGFREKPCLPDHRINAGFFVFDRTVFDQWQGNDLERQVLPALGSAGELYEYRHDGFWRSMDTYKDALELTALCGAEPPWLAEPPQSAEPPRSAEPSRSANS